MMAAVKEKTHDDLEKRHVTLRERAKKRINSAKNLYKKKIKSTVVKLVVTGTLLSSGAYIGAVGAAWAGGIVNNQLKHNTSTDYARSESRFYPIGYKKEFRSTFERLFVRSQQLGFLEGGGKLVNPRNWSPNKFVNVLEGMWDAKSIPDVSQLKRYADTGGMADKQAVAIYGHTPLKILEKLATDRMWQVRTALLLRTNIPEKVVDTLAKDKDRNISELAREVEQGKELRVRLTYSHAAMRYKKVGDEYVRVVYLIE